MFSDFCPSVLVPSLAVEAEKLEHIHRKELVKKHNRFQNNQQHLLTNRYKNIILRKVMLILRIDSLSDLLTFNIVCQLLFI